MSMRILVCTDLDRTLIPNGTQSESRGARARFSQFASHPGVTLAYVSGRHRALVEKAIDSYRLPIPDFVIGDVGTTIYHVGRDATWTPQQSWEQQIGEDWGQQSHADLKQLLQPIRVLRLQEPSKQNRHKLSYYVPMQTDREALSLDMQRRLTSAGARCNLTWSLDEPQGIGLLDVLPASASKYHAIEALMRDQGFDDASTVFCGDSGNDLEVLVSHIPSVLVANADPEIKRTATGTARRAGHESSLYIACGGLHGMNGNYSAGMLEGIAHYHPEVLPLMGLEEA